jgi:hypothetical protein
MAVVVVVVMPVAVMSRREELPHRLEKLLLLIMLLLLLLVVMLVVVAVVVVMVVVAMLVVVVVVVGVGLHLGTRHEVTLPEREVRRKAARRPQKARSGRENRQKCRTAAMTMAAVLSLMKLAKPKRTTTMARLRAQAR